jgi:uncharacterized protein
MKTVLLMALLSAWALTHAQPLPSNWEGNIPSQKKFMVAFQFWADSSGVMQAVMHSPGQGSFQIKCSPPQKQGDSIFFQVPSVQGRFEGKWQPETNSITGRWKQGTAIVPLTLNSIQMRAVYGKEKIQTPRAPFPYETEKHVYYSADSLVTLGATLTKPQGKGPFPAVILINGSGQQDRDATMLGHKPFAVMADYLTRKGYIVLRADDRGTGESRGDLKNATSAHFADDAETSLNFLLRRNDVDKKRVGLIGHSEGGLIAPMVAARRKEISFIVLLAAPGSPITDLMADQNEAILLSSGFKNEEAASYREFYKKLVTTITGSPNDSVALQKGIEEFKEWQKSEKEAIVTALSGVPQTNTAEKFVKTFVTQLSAPWWKFFLKYDPRPVLRALSCKVLALNGSADVQILPHALDSIKKALGLSRSKQYDIKELAGLNHLFQTCHYCVVGEYGPLQESFSPEALRVMGDWLDKNNR